MQNRLLLRHLHQSTRGYGLIEILLATALTAISFTAIATYMVSRSKEITRVSQTQMAHDIELKLQKIFEDNSICTKNVLGLDASLSISNSNNEVDLNQLSDGVDANSQVLMAVGQASVWSHELVVKRIYLSNWQELPGRRWLSDLRITFEEDDTLQSVVRRIMLNTSTGPPFLVTGCTTRNALLCDDPVSVQATPTGIIAGVVQYANPAEAYCTDGKIPTSIGVNCTYNGVLLYGSTWVTSLKRVQKPNGDLGALGICCGSAGMFASNHACDEYRAILSMRCCL